MRFERVELDRYGCFTGHALDFGKAKNGADFHIIYGPNEAGKSTLRDACIDFLYGIKTRTEYGFIHDYSVMQIGALLQIGNDDLHARRVKGAKDTLRSLQGGVLSESVLKAVLGDISRTGFEQMFSLNDASLEDGAEGILKSEGDLGALLFSAAAGLSAMGGGLRDAQTQADAFYRKRAQSSRLNQLKAELDEIETVRAGSDVEAAYFQALTERTESARLQHAKAEADRNLNVQRSNEISAILDALKPWAELLRLQETLKALEDAPTVPEGWDIEVDDLKTQHTKARATLETQSRTVKDMQDTLDKIQIDDAALAIADDVRLLTDGDLQARFLTARDIDKREQDRENAERLISEVAERLGQPAKDARSLVLEAGIAGEISGLLDRHAAILQAEETARGELDSAKRTADGAGKAVADLGDPLDIGPLVQLIQTHREDLTPNALQDAQDQVDRVKGQFDGAFAALAPFDGDSADLKTMQVPDRQDIEGLIAAGQEHAAARKTLDDKRTELQDMAAALDAEIKTLIEKAGVISDEQVHHARSVRDEAWRALRDPMDIDPPPSVPGLKDQADRFFETMNEDDRVLALRFGQTTERANLNRAFVEQSRMAAALERLSGEDATLGERENTHRSETKKVLASLRLPDNFRLSRLEVWLGSLATARLRLNELEDAMRQLDQKQTAHEAANASLTAAMKALGLLSSGKVTAGLMAECEAFVERQNEQNRLIQSAKTALVDANSKVDERQLQFQKAKAARENWDAAWADALGSVWIGARSPDAVRAILKTLETLPAYLRDVDDLTDRIDAMIEDRKTFAAEVKRLAAGVDETFDPDAPLQTARQLKQRVESAEAAAADHTNRAQELEQALGALKRTQAAARSIEERVSEMRETIPSENLDGLIAEVRRGKQKESLVAQIDGFESDIVSRLRAMDLASALKRLEAEASTQEQRDALTNELQALQNSTADADGLVSESFREWKNAEGELESIGSDGQPAQLEERKQALLLEIEDEAHAFMRLSAGILMVEEALRVYRETHRSSMMEAASAAFVRMTRGAFSKLDTATDGANEILVGVRADGSTIIASEMSRGTRFQLYLALRIAGHAEFANQREILPFFADDILEPFDDDRSRETFGLLHDMSKRGQVVYLTHHRHLCDLAREVCGPGVQVHELPDRAVANLA